jgi:hypothetical protein
MRGLLVTFFKCYMTCRLAVFLSSLLSAALRSEVRYYTSNIFFHISVITTEDRVTPSSFRTRRIVQLDVSWESFGFRLNLLWHIFEQDAKSAQVAIAN